MNWQPHTQRPARRCACLIALPGDEHAPDTDPPLLLEGLYQWMPAEDTFVAEADGNPLVFPVYYWVTEADALAGIPPAPAMAEWPWRGSGAPDAPTDTAAETALVPDHDPADIRVSELGAIGPDAPDEMRFGVWDDGTLTILDGDDVIQIPAADVARLARLLGDHLLLGGAA